MHIVENIACKDEVCFIKSQKDTPGGSAANTVIGLARLGCPTSIIGKIAEDDDGDLIELNLAMNEVYTNNLIYADKGNTGKVLGFVDEKGERCLYVDPGVNDEIALDEINLLNLSKCKIMHYTSFVGDSFKTQIELLDKLNDNTLLSFDPGMLYVQKGLKELKPILDKTDILLINENELRLLYEDYYKAIDCADELSVKEIAVHILDEGIQTVVVKKGSEGVFAITDSEECDVGTYECSVVDTTGAGDAFNGGLLAALAEGKDIWEAADFANALAALSVQKIGTTPSMPVRSEIDDFLNAHKK